MKQQNKQVITLLGVVGLTFGILTACGSSEPCTSCGATPAKEYRSSFSNEKQYYCEDCSSDCVFCNKTATESYFLSGPFGTFGNTDVIFMCKNCYEEKIVELEQSYGFYQNK